MERIEFIKTVLKEFEGESISYCILRNYEFLLNGGKPSDIESLDTVVSKKDYEKMRKILIENGFEERTQQFSLKHKAFFKLINLKKVSFDIQVGGVHWNDICYLDEKIILGNRLKKEFFNVPNNDNTFVMLLVHSILGKRFFKQKYQRILLELINSVNNKYIYDHLSNIFNKKVAKELICLVRNNQFDKIKTKNLVTYFLLKKPNHLTIFIALFFRWVKQRKNPFNIAPLISVIGPDGSGKSTLVNHLNVFLRDSGKNTSLVYTGRGRDHILPISLIGRKYKRAEKINDGIRPDPKTLVSEIAKSNPNNTNKKSLNGKIKRKILYTLAAPVFSLDLFLRYWFRIFPKRFNKNIVITDRYCSDIILMENVPFWFKRILLGLFPKPTISIYLYNSAQTLHERRPEESVSELDRQMAIFNKFNYDLKIKTLNKEKNRDIIINHISSYLMRNWW